MTVTYRSLRSHLIAEHGYTDAYFDEDYAIGGPIRELSTLRWLHAAWKDEPGHRDFEIDNPEGDYCCGGTTLDAMGFGRVACEECGATWIAGRDQCHVCGNRTWRR